MIADDSQSFRIESTSEHSKILLEFAACTMLHDPQMIHGFLTDHPFCVEGLLVYSEIARQSGEHQHAFELLRRAVYAAECGFDGAFSPFVETQVLGPRKMAFLPFDQKFRFQVRPYFVSPCFLGHFLICQVPAKRGEADCSVSWPRVRVQLIEDPSWPGWSWFTALWGYMLSLSSQGLPRTAFEVCKLILAMTLPNDPTHSLIHLDYFALRAEEYDAFLQICEKLNPPCDLPARTITRLDCCLPNFAYSSALAHYLRRSIKDEDETAALSTISVEDLTTPYWEPVLPSEGEGPSQAHLALMRAMLLFPRTLRSILESLGISLNTSASGSPCKLSWSELLDKSPLIGEKQILHQQHFLAHALVSDAFVQRCATFFRGAKMLRWLHGCAGRLTQMCESSLFEQELMAARRAWSEAPLAVSLADYKDFSTSEVGTERKAPGVLERAVNSLMGSTPIVQEPEDIWCWEFLVARTKRSRVWIHITLPHGLPYCHFVVVMLEFYSLETHPIECLSPSKSLHHSSQDEEAQLQRALRASQAAEDAQERRRLIEEQNQELRESLAADAEKSKGGYEDAADALARLVKSLACIFEIFITRISIESIDLRSLKTRRIGASKLFSWSVDCLDREKEYSFSSVSQAIGSHGLWQSRRSRCSPTNRRRSRCCRAPHVKKEPDSRAANT